MIRVRNISSNLASDRIHRHQSDHIRVYTGDVATSTKPVVLEALLGSCVAVCLHDPVRAAGGMNHILLPGKHLDAYSTRYGVHAMEMLINELMKQGGDRRRFVAKVFGGASVLPRLITASIGNDNAKFVREFLATERIPLLAQCLGGTRPVQVWFKTHTGKATVRLVSGSQVSRIAHAEESYWRGHLADGDAEGEITLF